MPDFLTSSLGVTDLTPNVGMWWYFFNEMFDHFRPFFRGVFQVSRTKRAIVGPIDINGTASPAHICGSTLPSAAGPPSSRIDHGRGNRYVEELSYARRYGSLGRSTELLPRAREK